MLALQLQKGEESDDDALQSPLSYMFSGWLYPQLYQPMT